MASFTFLDATFVCWLVLGFYWLVNAANTKKTVYEQKYVQRFLTSIGLIVGFMLIYSSTNDTNWISTRIIPQTMLSGVIGLIVCAGGVAFAIWARWTLGRNWSSAVTIKKNHELVQTGPYTIVRHPIYSGFLLAVLGTAIALGQVSGFLAVLLVFGSFLYKLKQEEKLMSQQFPKLYPLYKKRVKALIPHII